MGAVVRRIQVSSSKESLMSRAMLQCFFTAEAMLRSKMMSYFNAEEEQLAAIIKKFQVLYSCNLNSFRETARTVMAVLFKDSVDSPMIRKYFKEVERLHE